MDYYDLPIEGKHAVVVGRSPILGIDDAAQSQCYRYDLPLENEEPRGACVPGGYRGCGRRQT